jgi:hypothetical protein
MCVMPTNYILYSASYAHFVNGILRFFCFFFGCSLHNIIFWIFDVQNMKTFGFMIEENCKAYFVDLSQFTFFDTNTVKSSQVTSLVIIAGNCVLYYFNSEFTNKINKITDKNNKLTKKFEFLLVLFVILLILIVNSLLK